jgi:hypothetical protein
MMQNYFQDIQIEKRIMAEYVGEVKGVDLSHFDSWQWRWKFGGSKGNRKISICS